MAINLFSSVSGVYNIYFVVFARLEWKVSQRDLTFNEYLWVACEHIYINVSISILTLTLIRKICVLPMSCEMLKRDLGAWSLHRKEPMEKVLPTHSFSPHICNMSSARINRKNHIQRLSISKKYKKWFISQRAQCSDLQSIRICNTLRTKVTATCHNSKIMIEFGYWCFNIFQS